MALASRVDAFLPSREELANLVGYDDPRLALAELAKLPIPIVVAKLGVEGCLVWDARAKRLVQVGISTGDVVDVTGAGDAFCGGFVASLSTGVGAVEAARRGAVSAAFAIAGFSSLSLADLTPSIARARLVQSPPSVSAFAVDEQVPLGTGPGRPTTVGPAPGADARSIGIMRAEIDAIPSVIADQRAVLASRLAELAGSLVAEGIEHAHFVGCGDSMFAGQAASLAFARHAGVAAQGVHALDLARYRVRYLPKRSLVVCISYSGEVGRTIEAAAQAREHGHRVVALTGNATGRLAAEADDVVVLDVPTLGFSPGTNTYVAMLTALLELAAAWGRARGSLTDDELAGAPELARATLAAVTDPARALAARFVGAPSVTFLGAGPNEASARFGAAKLMEGPQMLGVATNLEEWAHEEYFVSGRGTPVVVIAPWGAAYDRAVEILSELVFIGAAVALVSDREPPSPEMTWLPLSPGLGEEHSPLVAALPLSLLAFFLAEAAGNRSYNFPSPEAEREHYDTIHRDTRGTPA